MSQSEITVDELADRVERLERIVGLNSEEPGGSPFDHMDRTVLAVLESEDPIDVKVEDLNRLYRKHTDIRRKKTLRNRIKRLTREGPFKKGGMGIWIYDP